MMALMIVMLIWMDRRRERKTVAGACGLTVWVLVVVESWVKASRIQDLVTARSMPLSFPFVSGTLLVHIRVRSAKGMGGRLLYR